MTNEYIEETFIIFKVTSDDVTLGEIRDWSDQVTPAWAEKVTDGIVIISQEIYDGLVSKGHLPSFFDI